MEASPLFNDVTRPYLPLGGARSRAYSLDAVLIYSSIGFEFEHICYKLVFGDWFIFPLPAINIAIMYNVQWC